MLEIFLMRGLLKRIGDMLRSKGRSPTGHQVLTAVLWIGLEITGLVVGFSNGMGNGAIVLGLLGAGVGAGAGWVIASAAEPKATNDELKKVFD